MYEDKGWRSRSVCGKAVDQRKVKFHMLGRWGKILFIDKASFLFVLQLDFIGNLLKKGGVYVSC